MTRPFLTAFIIFGLHRLTLAESCVLCFLTTWLVVTLLITASSICNVLLTFDFNVFVYPGLTPIRYACPLLRCCYRFGNSVAPGHLMMSRLRSSWYDRYRFNRFPQRYQSIELRNILNYGCTLHRNYQGSNVQITRLPEINRCRRSNLGYTLVMSVIGLFKAYTSSLHSSSAPRSTSCSNTGDRNVHNFTHYRHMSCVLAASSWDMRLSGVYVLQCVAISQALDVNIELFFTVSQIVASLPIHC